MSTVTTTGFSIKNAEADELSKRLMEHYGTNRTQAFIRAAQEVLSTSVEERMRRYQEQIDAVIAELRSHAGGDLSGLSDEGMYDEDGLPLW